MGRYKKPFSLYKRGDYWYYRTYTPDGKRTTAKTTGQRLKKNAAAYCEELLKVNQLGLSTQTFKDYAEHFFDDNSVFLTDRPGPLSESTIRIYRTSLERFLLPEFAGYKLVEITFSRVKMFRQKLLNQGYSANHINNIFTAFKQVMNYAYMDSLIIKNPLQGISSLARTSTKDGFTRTEVIKIIADCPAEIQDFLILLAITGVRFSEGFGLRKEDIKQKDGVYYFDLHQQLTSELSDTYTPLKTKKSRMIPIPADYALSFERTKSTRSHIKLHSRLPIRQCDKWQERNLSLHSIRHFFCTDPKVKGVNPLIVESIAGHSLKGIEQVYTNFHLEDLQQLIKWQEDLLQEIKSNLK